MAQQDMRQSVIRTLQALEKELETSRLYAVLSQMLALEHLYTRSTRPKQVDFECKRMEE